MESSVGAIQVLAGYHVRAEDFSINQVHASQVLDSRHTDDLLKVKCIARKKG